MIFQEKRIVPREPIQGVPPEAVTLVVGGKLVQVEKLRDISSQGISLELGKELPVSEKISLRYTDKTASVEVHGRVAWCRPQADMASRYLLGLELMSPMMLLAVLPRTATQA